MQPTVKGFETPIYIIHNEEFLEDAKKSANFFLNMLKNRPDYVIDPIFPTIQSGPMNDSKLIPFVKFITQTAWDILNGQGYDMKDYYTFVTDIWAQEFLKHGQQFEHVHGDSTQITGFYFLEVPENSSFPRFKDPRQAKLQLDLPIRDHNVMSLARSDFMLKVEPGDFVFTNAYLEHSFVPNKSDESFKFIHFNIITSKKSLHNVRNNIPPQTEERNVLSEVEVV
jgi:Putative 2OG-Fe(II) oxygenase